jgi:hypothetical protein
LEYRLRRKRCVQGATGIEKLEDLFSDLSSIRNAFHTAVRKLLPEEIERPEADAEGMQQVITAAFEALEERGKRAHVQTLQALGLRYLQETDSLDSFFNAVREHGSRMAESRYRDKYESLTPITDLFSEHDRTRVDMLEELRSKLLA